MTDELVTPDSTQGFTLVFLHHSFIYLLTMSHLVAWFAFQVPYLLSEGTAVFQFCNSYSRTVNDVTRERINH